MEKSSKDSQQNNLVWINVKDFEDLCFWLATEHLSYNEPIPAFTSRYPGILESCIESPLQTFGTVDLYPTLTEKLTALFYFLIKNHPFQNGNKRIALATLLAVLYLNKKWIKANMQSIYELAVETAASDRMDKDIVFKRINDFISQNIEDVTT